MQRWQFVLIKMGMATTQQVYLIN